jgi:ketosteroid isomerase-like protein
LRYDGGGMPSANILLIEKIYEGIVSRDFGIIPKYFHPDVEVRQSTDLPWGGHFTGQQGVVTFFSGVLANVDSVVVTERLIDAGDHVIQVGFTRGTARQTGKPFDVPEVHMWHIVDGKVKGFYAYIDHPAMLAAIR